MPWVDGQYLDGADRWLQIQGDARMRSQPEHAAAVEIMLLGIRRELDQWPETWEHRCWTMERSERGTIPRCSTCGAWSMLHVSTWRAIAELEFRQLFDELITVVRGAGPFDATPSRWTGRPGTTLERR